MKDSFTTHELEIQRAKDRLQNDSCFGNPALHTIKRSIREGHLSRMTSILILLLIIGALAFCVYFVTSDSEAVHQAQMLIEAQKASQS